MKRPALGLVTVALAVTVSACTGATTPPNTLRGLTPGEIVDTATAAALHFGGAHYNIQNTGTAAEPDGTGDAGVNAGDEILTAGNDKVALLYVKPNVFVRGNASGLEDILAINATIAQRGADKWISIPADNPLWQQISSAMTISGLLDELRPTGTLEESSPGQLGKYQVIGVRGNLGQGKAGQATFWVSTASPNVLTSAETKSTGTPSPSSSTSSTQGSTDLVIVFSKWGERIRLTPPTPVLTYASIAG